MLAEAASANPTVTGAIRQASQLTGTSFGYLLATARVESNFNPNATVKTSSARGLYQFIDQTWLATVKEQGAALGYGRYASAIERTSSGRYEVTNPLLRNSVMNLRNDPVANATMAGAFTKANAQKLQSALGRQPSEGELYLAHFMGPAGATRLIGLATSTPSARAAETFPGAARANPTIFYDKGGRMRSASEVYRTLVGRYDVARGGAKEPMMAAATAPSVAPGRVAAVAPANTHRAVSVPDTARLNEAYAAAVKTPAARQADGPMFYGLFRTSAGREAVAPAVSALWTSPNAPMPVAANAPAPVTNAATRVAAARPSAETVRENRANDPLQSRVLDAGRLLHGPA